MVGYMLYAKFSYCYIVQKYLYIVQDYYIHIVLLCKFSKCRDCLFHYMGLAVKELYILMN